MLLVTVKHSRLHCVYIPTMLSKVFFNLQLLVIVSSNVIIKQGYEDERFRLIRHIIDFSENKKGWINFLTVGNWPDAFYKEMQGIPMTFLAVNEGFDEYEVEEILRYRANTLAIESEDFEDFENKINIVIKIPFWHPHSNTIVYHKSTESDEIIAKMFYSLWYYRAPNVIILQYNNALENWVVTYFNPYINENYKLESSYGCWTRRKVSYAVANLQEDIVCTKECHNVTLYSKLRAEHIGTCLGFQKTVIRNTTNIQEHNFFEAKARNMHGFTLRAYVTEVKPFLVVDENDDGTYTLNARDGLIWTTISEILNFTMDLSLNAKTMKRTFDFELSIQQIFDFARRKGDLMLLPVYQYDLVIVDVDMTTAFKDSGVCFMSHRADFETTLFDVNLLKSNYTKLIEFQFCFLGIWFIFFIYNVVEKGVISHDQAGKDFVNAIRNVLSLSLFKPPKKQSFKIYLFVSIWCFFVMNFATQAAIISFFSAFKRGKEVETYEDIIEKGYIIEGMASPDVMLPETEEKFQKINAKLVPIRDLFGCVNHMTNDSRRFCLIDCSVGKYLVRNKLNAKGEQFLHIAKDMVHNHYLHMIFQKYSPITDEYNRNILRIIQAGLINKWEQYRYTDMKYEAPVKSLDIDDLIGIFKCYALLVGLSAVTFVLEIGSGTSKMLYRKLRKNRVSIS